MAVLFAALARTELGLFAAVVRGALIGVICKIGGEDLGWAGGLVSLHWLW